MVASYLAESQLPTDELHRVTKKGRNIPLGLSGLWVVRQINTIEMLQKSTPFSHMVDRKVLFPGYYVRSSIAEICVFEVHTFENASYSQIRSHV